MKIEDAIQAFLDAKRAANRSAETLRSYRYHLAVFVDWLCERAPLDWFRPEIVEAFMACEYERGMSAATVAGRFRALRAFFNWLKHRKYVAGHASLPTDGVQAPQTPVKPVDYVHLHDYRRLYESIVVDSWLGCRDRCIVMILFWSGLRVAEVTGLRYGDFDFNLRLLTVRSAKSGKARIVPCTEDLAADLIAYIYSRPPYDGLELFVSNDGAGGVRGPITPVGVRLMLRRRFAVARIPYRSPHKFRHGFAMEFLNAGMDMSAVSKTLGHSSVKVTEAYYAHWLTEGLAREYAETRRRLETKRP